MNFCASTSCVDKGGRFRDCNASVIIAAAAGMAKYYGMMTNCSAFLPAGDDRQVADTFTCIVMDGIRGPKFSEETVMNRLSYFS